MEAPGATLEIIDGGGRRQAKGRLNQDQQEAVINLAPVKERIEELERLYNRRLEASTAFGDAIKACAEKAGLNAGPLKKFVIARVKEKLPELQRDQDQLALLFFDVGE